jgi:hypothetical protein
MEFFNQPDILLAYGQSIRFKETIPIEVMNYKKRILFEGNNSKKLLFFNTIAGHNMIFRKELLKHAVPFHIDVYFDWWIAMVASCVGKIAATDAVLTFHRFHSNNVTLGKKDEKKQTRSKAIERIKTLRAFIELNEMNDGCKQLAQKLHKKLIVLEQRTFSFSLFLFLFCNAKTFFFFKKSFFPTISYFKISYRLSWAKTGN